MRKIQKIAAVVILILACFTVYGFWETRQPVGLGPSIGNGKSDGDAAATPSLVDQLPLKTAQQLSQLATTPEERPLAQEALRLADYDLDLAFADAIREARLHPPPLSKDAKESKARVDKAEKILEAEQERGTPQLVESTRHVIPVALVLVHRVITTKERYRTPAGLPGPYKKRR